MVRPVEGHVDLFGVQDGPDGFVRVGTGERGKLAAWEDRLNLGYFGGRGAGKSAALALRMGMYALSWPGSFSVATAPSKTTWDNATLPAIKKMWAMMGLVEGEHWWYGESKRRIQFCRELGGAEIVFISADDPEHLRGPDCAAGFMDEARECPFEAYQNMKAMLRQPGYPHQCTVVSTPAGKAHWIYQVFYPGEYGLEEPLFDALARRGGRYLPFNAWTEHNPWGGKEFHDEMAPLYGGVGSLRYRQEMRGEFVIMQGVVFDSWDETLFVKDPKTWPTRTPNRIAGAIDFGYEHRAAILVGGVDSQERQYLLDEFSESHVDTPTFVAQALSMQKKWGVEVFFCDNEDAQAIADLRKGGVRAVKANKSVGTLGDFKSGIGRMAYTLNRRDEHDQPMFFVDPACRIFRREIPNYVRAGVKDPRRMEISERPVQVGDDEMDAWRYLENGFWKLGLLRMPGAPSAGAGTVRTERAA